MGYIEKSNPNMSDAEIKRRKKAQGHISQATGALGLAALSTRLGAKGPAKLATKLPKLKALDEARMKDVSNTLATTGAGIGGAGSFNFASYTAAESRQRKARVTPPPPPRQKKETMQKSAAEDGFYGETTEISKGLARDAAVLGGIGAGVGAGVGAAGGYAQGRTGQLNRKQAKKMGKISGATAGGVGGLFLGGPFAAVGGAVAGGAAGGHYAHKGASRRINGKSETMQKSAAEDGFYGEIGKRELFDAERNRLKRAEHYKTAADVGAGVLGTGAVHQAVGVGRVVREYNKPNYKQSNNTPRKGVALGLKRGGRAAALTAAAGGALYGGSKIEEKKKPGGSWSPYVAKSGQSAFGVLHD